jgi:hypothetical protein
MMNSDTIIGDIRTETRNYEAKVDAITKTARREGRSPYREIFRLSTPDRITEQAEQLFGQLNGWHTGPDVHQFNVSDIGKRSAAWRRGGDPSLDHRLFDHSIFYRGQGKCAALVTQPYNDPIDALLKLANSCGVVCHIPPYPKASLHSPGSTHFYVFTSPEHRIVWLPEQINGIREKVEV